MTGMINAIRFEGADFSLYLEDLSPELLEALKECGVGGRSADPYVKEVMENFDISGDKEDCRKYLEGYGAWEDAELENHQENLTRLVWLTGSSIIEEGDVYFCNY